MTATAKFIDCVKTLLVIVYLGKWGPQLHVVWYLHCCDTGALVTQGADSSCDIHVVLKDMIL